VKTSLVAVLMLLCSTSGYVHAASSEALLIEGGRVMTMDPMLGDIEDGDVLIRNGRIVAVGQNLDAGGARRIDARGQVVLPGFVDAHNHLYVTLMRGQFRNGQGQFFPVSARLAAHMTAQDTYVAMRLGALELLNAGITTTGDFFDNVISPAHGEAGVRALEDAGIRATLFYGGPDKTTQRQIDLEQLQALTRQQGQNARVRMGLAWRLPRNRDDAANWAMRQREYATAQRLGLPVQVHVSGEAQAMFDALIEPDYLDPRLAVIHATDARPEQLRALEKAGAALVLTPISEHRVGYGLTRLDHFNGVRRQGLGIDGNALAGSADMFATLRLAALTWSGATHDEGAPPPRALLDLATRGGAKALGLGGQIGTLTPGKRADVQIVALDALNLAGFGGGDPAALLVYSARPENVRTVVVDGHLVKLEGQLQGVELPRVLEEAAASAQQLVRRSGNQ
jgi:cytosine/adenosine deaminase-related metal-dependent hydrolase